MKTRCKFVGYSYDTIYDICPECGVIMGCYSKEGGYIECVMCPDESKLRDLENNPRTIEAPFECMRCMQYG